MIKPILAYKKPPTMTDDEWFASLRFPLLATPKIDGIRCTIQDNLGWTRSLKQIPNAYIRTRLRECPDFLDGELTCGSNFQAVTSGIMSYDGQPNFSYYVFDFGIHSTLNYAQRTQSLNGAILPDFCKKLIPVNIENLEQLLAYEADCLSKGAEGVMLRPHSSPYLQSRASATRPYLIAIKRFTDAEATITGFEEQLENQNEKVTNALGLSERSSHSANLIPKNTLGALIVYSEQFGSFKIGTGMDDATKQKYWNERHGPNTILGKLVKFKYQQHGTKDKPRCPVFLGIRSNLDI